MLVQSITNLNSFNRYQMRQHNVNFKSNSEREAELERLRLANLKRLQEEEEEQKQQAFEAVMARIKIKVEAAENDFNKERARVAKNTMTVNKILERERKFQNNVNAIKIKVLLEKAAEGDSEWVADFKSELERKKQKRERYIEAREEAKERMNNEYKNAVTKKAANQAAALNGSKLAQAEIFWANAKIIEAEQFITRYNIEKSNDADDIENLNIMSEALKEAEKILADNKPTEIVPSRANINSNNTNNKQANKSIIAQTGEKQVAINKKSDEKYSTAENTENVVQEKQAELLAEAQNIIQKYPSVNNEMSTKMARFLLGFVCTIQNNTDHKIGEYFGDENTAKTLRESLPPECQRRSIAERESLQEFCELKDPIMMLIAANNMKKFAPKPGVLNAEQQANLVDGLKNMITMAVGNTDLSKFDNDDRISINEILQMIKVSDSVDFGISVKLQSLINKLNQKKLNLDFMLPSQMRQSMQQVTRTIKL